MWSSNDPVSQVDSFTSCWNTFLLKNWFSLQSSEKSTFMSPKIVVGLSLIIHDSKRLNISKFSSLLQPELQYKIIASKLSALYWIAKKIPDFARFTIGRLILSIFEKTDTPLPGPKFALYSSNPSKFLLSPSFNQVSPSPKRSDSVIQLSKRGKKT